MLGAASVGAATGLLQSVLLGVRGTDANTTPQQRLVVRKECSVKPMHQRCAGVIAGAACPDCSGSGRCVCRECHGRGRSNLVAEGMLPDGVWPQWCSACRGSGLWYCRECLGDGKPRKRIGFRMPTDD